MNRILRSRFSHFDSSRESTRDEFFSPRLLVRSGGNWYNVEVVSRELSDASVVDRPMPDVWQCQPGFRLKLLPELSLLTEMRNWETIEAVVESSSRNPWKRLHDGKTTVYSRIAFPFVLRSLVSPFHHNPDLPSFSPSSLSVSLSLRCRLPFIVLFSVATLSPLNCPDNCVTALAFMRFFIAFHGRWSSSWKGKQPTNEHF